MNLYIANLDYSINDDFLMEIFSAFGEVTSAKVITDKYTGRSKGFGFVEMTNNEDAQKAIDELNGSSVNVSQAKPRTEDGGRYKSRGGSGGYKSGGSFKGGGGSKYSF